MLLLESFLLYQLCSAGRADSQRARGNERWVGNLYGEWRGRDWREGREPRGRLCWGPAYREGKWELLILNLYQDAAKPTVNARLWSVPCVASAGQSWAGFEFTTVSVPCRAQLNFSFMFGLTWGFILFRAYLGILHFSLEFYLELLIFFLSFVCKF